MPKQVLTQRPDGRYRVKFKGREFYGYTQSEALAKRDEYRRQLEAGLREEKLGITFGEYAAEWLQIYKKGHVRESSYINYTRAVQNMISHLGTRRLKDITLTQLQQYLNTLEGRSRGHINLIKTMLNDIFVTAANDGIILRNPCANLKSPEGYSGTHRYIQQFERDLILQSVGLHPMAIPAMLMLYAGLRRGEAAAIDLDKDIDYEHNCILVSKQMSSDGISEPVASTKTEYSNRKVPLLPILADALRSYHGLAITRTNGRPINDSSFAAQWRSYLRLLTRLHNGIDPRGHLMSGTYEPVFIRTHDLRHSYATMLYESGIDVKSAAKWMGHADTDMIMKVYAHLSTEQENSAARRLIEYSKSLPQPSGSNRGSII